MNKMKKDYKICPRCRYRRKEIDIIKKYGVCIRCLFLLGEATEEILDKLNKRLQ